MKVDEFRNSPSGRLVSTEGGRMAFVPNALPPKLDYEIMARIAPHLARAERILGELNGIGRTLDDPMLLVRPLQFQEAMTSSSMEGTYTTVDEFLLVEAGEQRNMHSDTLEVQNYRRALSEALASLETLPLSLRTLKEAHKTLLSDVTKTRGAGVRAGEFKIYQNFIGSTVEKARFVPPPPREAAEAMADLELYMHRANAADVPDLIEAALIHYQFETIHPFADGNGRVGRMLITLHLIMRGAMKQPLLYLSPVFEQRKNDYIDTMFEVSRSGQWTDWIIFFLNVVEQSAAHAVRVADRLLKLKTDYRHRLQVKGRSARLFGVVDLLFSQPFISIPQIATHLGVTYPAAQKAMIHLLDAGIVVEFPTLSNPKYFYSEEIRNTVLTSVTSNA